VSYWCACAHIVQHSRKMHSGFHDTISNGFIDSAFLRLNAAKLQLCSTHMCFYLFSYMVNWTCCK